MRSKTAKISTYSCEKYKVYEGGEGSVKLCLFVEKKNELKASCINHAKEEKLLSDQEKNIKLSNSGLKS